MRLTWLLSKLGFAVRTPNLKMRQAGPALDVKRIGWEMFDEIRDCGFSEVEALFYWSSELGYLGIDQIAFVAQAGK